MVTTEVGAFEDRLERCNYDVELRFLVRCLTAVATGQSRYPRLRELDEHLLQAARHPQDQESPHADDELAAQPTSPNTTGSPP